MTVTCVDDPPTAVNDAATVAEDSGATAVTVLANDTDIDGGPKSIASVTQPANGVVVITGGGTGLTYAPNANYCNTPIPPGTVDTFTYTLTPAGPTPTATVSMTVTCVDDAPVAVNDAATVVEDSGATAINVLANDTDVDGGPKSIASFTPPANGVVQITGGGTGLTYQPNADYCNNPPGTTLDTFTYTLTPAGPTPTATVTVTVTCVNDPPTDIALSKSDVDENQPINTVVGTFSTTDPDVGDPHTYTLAGGAGSTDNGSFNISGSQLRTSAVLNFEGQLVPVDDPSGILASCPNPDDPIIVVICREGRRHLGIAVGQVLDVAAGSALFEAGTETLSPGVTLLKERVTPVVDFAGSPEVETELTEVMA